jgi:hypothetical protein
MMRPDGVSSIFPSKMTEFDGLSSFSGIVSVMSDLKRFAGRYFWPNSAIAELDTSSDATYGSGRLAGLSVNSTPALFPLFGSRVCGRLHLPPR